MKLKWIYIAFFSLMLFISCDLTYQIVTPTVYGDYNQIIRKGITFRWNISNSNMNIVLIAPTMGWVGVGLKATSLMQDANIIMGYVEDTNSLEISDRYGISETNHSADTDLDGSSDFTAYYGYESNDVTEIAFSIPLESGDDYDRPLYPGAGVYIKCFLAYGMEDSFSNDYYHISYFGIELLE